MTADGFVAHGLVTRTGRRRTAPLDAHVSAGSAARLTGPNGAGKTTLLAVIAGRLPVLGGTVRYAGADLCAVRRRGQITSFGPDLRPPPRAGFLQWASARAPFYGISPRALEDAAERWEVTSYATQPLSQLSTGMRWRCALAFAFARRDGIVALDEPERSLDATGLTQLNAEIQAHCAHGGVCLIATHDLGGQLLTVDDELPVRWCR